MTPKNIILLGPAGAGKSSQMAQIHLYTNCECISLGNILRAAGFLKTPLGKRVQRTIEAGQLIDDETANAIVFTHILELPKGRGFVLDGYPRNVDQAKEMIKFLALNKISLHAIIELDLPDEVASERIHVHAQLSQKGALQDVDETDLAIDNRLKTYRDEIDGIRGEIKSLSKYVVIDANQPLNAVTLEVLKVVEH